MAITLALVTCFILVPLSAVVVDIGMMRVARGDMQAVADVVALDMARAVSHGDTPTDALAGESAARTRGTVGVTPRVHVLTGHVDDTGPFVADQSLGCDGSGSVDDGYFSSTVPAGKVANAVLVTATTDVEHAIMGGSGSVCRSAIAGAVNAACYDVGSYAAMADTSQSALLDPLFRQLAQQSGRFSNGGVVSALSYKGLAGAHVDLAVLAADLGIGSVSELAGSTVQLHDLYVAALDALEQPRDATSVSVLSSLIDTTGSFSGSVDLGTILRTSSGVEGLAEASMNLLDLVGGSIAAINGTNVASVNIGSTTLPGVSNANAQVRLIQGPHRFCGTPGDSATTATDPALTEQLAVSMTAQLDPQTATIAVPAIPGVMGATSATVALPNNVTTTISIAPTTTTLTAATCAATKGVDIDVENGLATVSIDTYLSNIVVNADLLALKILNIPVASVNAKIAINAHVKVTATLSDSGVVHFSITVPPQQFDTAYPTSNTGVGLGSPTLLDTPSIQANSNVTLLGIISAGASISLDASQKSQILANVTRSVVEPMFDNLNPNSFVSRVVNPFLALLGAQVGGSDISLSASPPPGCTQPRLRG